MHLAPGGTRPDGMGARFSATSPSCPRTDHQSSGPLKCRTSHDDRRSQFHCNAACRNSRMLPRKGTITSRSSFTPARRKREYMKAVSRERSA
jgi:hypothetical protein